LTAIASFVRPAALLLAALITAALPSPADGAGMATFRLANVDPAGSDPVREAFAVVLPTGSVRARDVGNDPPTILDASTGFVSSGFDPEDLVVSLGDGTIDNADGTTSPFQALKLDFGPDGLAAGGKLYFQLAWSSDYDPSLGLIRLTLPSDVTNLAIETLDVSGLPDPNGSTGGGNSEPPAPQVPEPTTWAGWSLATVAALAARYARGQRRRLVLG
jgi:hypothetical protein